jgi:hypothetical protein
MRRATAGVLAGAVAAVAACASTAAAADRIYWADRAGGMIPPVGFANLDGSGGGNPLTTGASPGFAEGMTIDAGAGRLYWANGGADKISFANLDGSGGGGDLLDLKGPQGLAVDPSARRIYWANYADNKISFAGLDGGAGGDLNTGAATVASPISVALDPAGGRIYWANNTSPKISYANLDGSGGGDVDTTGATVAAAWGLAVDTAAGRIYWGNSSAPQGIYFANLNGSGGGQLVTTGATVQDPAGVAVDVPAGRVYWANGNGTISSAGVTGADGRNLDTSGAVLNGPNQVALLRAPVAAGVPSLSGGFSHGSVLSCSPGVWAPDLPASHLYRVPQTSATQWNRNGTAIPGATGSAIVADVPGVYTCTVTGSNVAGSASQTSGGHVVDPGFGDRTLVTLRLARRRIGPRERLPIRVANRNDFPVRVQLSGRGSAEVRASRRRVVRLRTARFDLGSGRGRTVRLRVPRLLRRELVRKGRLRLRISAAVTDPSRNSRTVRKRIVPRLKRPGGARARLAPRS